MKRLIRRVAPVCLIGLAAVCAFGAGQTREYWVSADEALWDFAPSYPENLITGQPFTAEQRVFVEPVPGSRKGHQYLKAIYRQYTPGFGAIVPKPDYLGILGPIIRAEVGDTIVVHFRNMTRFPASMHPHGVMYDKNSEGAPYQDGTNLKGDDAVPPNGGEHTYIWQVPERAGPGPADPSSVVWEYHSHTNEPADTNAGLIGPMIITRRGMARPDGSPTDVDREFITLFNIFDENVSKLADANFEGLSPTDPDAFGESNLMHSMNGLVYGNNRGYVMRQGERVRWYLIGMGTEVDVHSAHWHGETAIMRGQRVDVVSLMPAVVRTVDLEADNPGTWLYHCHVNDHVIAGMITTYTILPPEQGGEERTLR